MSKKKESLLSGTMEILLAEWRQELRSLVRPWPVKSQDRPDNFDHHWF